MFRLLKWGFQLLILFVVVSFAGRGYAALAARSQGLLPPDPVASMFPEPQTDQLRLRGVNRDTIQPGKNLPGTDLVLVEIRESDAVFAKPGGETAVRRFGDSVKFDGPWANVSGTDYNVSGRIIRVNPPAPDDVIRAADELTFRDFLTVALVVPQEDGFPDNWIYIHSPEVSVGRVQNFGSWSPQMIPEEGKTCLGLEYFVNEGDELWTARDDDLIALASQEMATLKLLDPKRVERGYVVRMPKAYPMYDASYKENVDTIRGWLSEAASNVHPVGRNGMHRYNNQDHSMYTAMLTVENLINGTNHDVWEVNVEADYHEELKVDPTPLERHQHDSSQ